MRIGEKNESVSLRKQMNAKNKAVSNRWIGNKFIKLTISKHTHIYIHIYTRKKSMYTTATATSSDQNNHRLNEWPDKGRTGIESVKEEPHGITKWIKWRKVGKNWRIEISNAKSMAIFEPLASNKYQHCMVYILESSRSKNRDKKIKTIQYFKR